jgi:hypothetical protein
MLATPVERLREEEAIASAVCSTLAKVINMEPPEREFFPDSRFIGLSAVGYKCQPHQPIYFLYN